LLVVIAIIITLAGLILATSGYVQKKGARSRAEAEIAAMSAALESYKADNGIYPTDQMTDQLDPTASNARNPDSYKPAGKTAYKYLSGDIDQDPTTPADDQKNYLGALIKPNSVGIDTDGKRYFKDPWGYAYGYSTSKSSGGNGYNPTFDLWSTAGGTRAADLPGWIKNW
jgi:type II secretory pathway pseudopilin PulG